MKTNTIITWSAAEQEARKLQKEQEKEQEEKLQEYLDSNHDMFDMRDFRYYADVTGKSIDWILENSNKEDNLIYQFYGSELDEDDILSFEQMLNY